MKLCLSASVLGKISHPYIRHGFTRLLYNCIRTKKLSGHICSAMLHTAYPRSSVSGHCIHVRFETTIALEHETKVDEPFHFFQAFRTAVHEFFIDALIAVVVDQQVQVICLIFVCSPVKEEKKAVSRLTMLPLGIVLSCRSLDFHSGCIVYLSS